MNDLDQQKTEHLLILLKAIMEHRYSGIEEEKRRLTNKIIEIMANRIEPYFKG